MKIEDEHGTPWVVSPGDHAAKAVRSLRTRGYEYIVLPRGTLGRGTIEVLPETPDNLIRAVRLNDCLAALKAGS